MGEDLKYTLYNVFKIGPKVARQELGTELHP